MQLRWYIRLTEENYSTIVDWHKKIDVNSNRSYTIGSYYGVLGNNKGDAWSKKVDAERYQIITFEQFKRYVLKLDSVEEFILPEKMGDKSNYR